MVDSQLHLLPPGMFAKLFKLKKVAIFSLLVTNIGICEHVQLVRPTNERLVYESVGPQGTFSYESLKPSLDQIVVIAFSDSSDQALKTNLDNGSYVEMVQRLARALEKYSPRCVGYDFDIPVRQEKGEIEKFFPKWNSQVPIVLPHESFSEIERRSKEIPIQLLLAPAHCKAVIDSAAYKPSYSREWSTVANSFTVEARYDGCFSLSCQMVKRTMPLIREADDTIAVHIALPTEKFVRTIPIENVLGGRISPDELRGKYVLVGSNHENRDVWLLRNGERFNGIYSHAISLAALLKFYSLNR